MHNKSWIKVAVLLVSLILMVSVSCSKKTVTREDESFPTASEDNLLKSGVDNSSMQEANVDSAASMRQDESDFVLQENIYFEFDKATLTPQARETIIKNGQWLRINRDVKITIEGHCDERGTNEYNLALGDRRAETVKTFLADLGIHPSRLTTISYGEEQPADPSHTEFAWTKNRRAHFLIREF
jgi:peptidoglycan-associated lipoprotein